MERKSALNKPDSRLLKQLKEKNDAKNFYRKTRFVYRNIDYYSSARYYRNFNLAD
ncbi:hypothetical protein KL86DYS1_31437 [uncultured Dysgonomonas sp.]|uniref:Uncharacterized protein n=1 Tax=uncultured Dysgonomonas sp. TaxID=206096 RepID=A0A212K4V7_9BACT|nr:hypothetical protein KL86DYS1_31437 [uncultured Dysgonomonas sp.]